MASSNTESRWDFRLCSDSDFRLSDCPLEKVALLELAHLLQKDGHDIVIFIGVQRLEWGETPHTQDTMTEAGQRVHWDPPPTVT